MSARHQRRRGVLLSCLLILMLFAASPSEAGLIRVSQESLPGAGDFDLNILGFVSSFSTPLTAAGFYQYNVPHGASYNGELNGGPDPVSSLTQVFLVEASNGLSLFVVHDRPLDGSGGNVRNHWQLTGGTAAFLVGDDPGEGLTVGGGGTLFDTNHTWSPCCTDGYVIGDLEGNWAAFGEFSAAPTGITRWAVVSDGGGPIALELEVGRRVRLDAEAVPEPGTLSLLALGMALGHRVRRRGGLRRASPAQRA